MKKPINNAKAFKSAIERMKDMAHAPVPSPGPNPNQPQPVVAGGGGMQPPPLEPVRA